MASWYERIISADGSLKGRERSDRRLLFIVSIICLFMATAFYIVAPEHPFFLTAYFVIVALANLPMLLVFLFRLPVTKQTVRIYVCCMAAGLVLCDLYQRSLSYPPLWPLMVLVADAALLLRLGTQFATRMMAVSCLWVVISGAESVFRFGLFDLPCTAPDSLRWERMASSCNCDTPPCAFTILHMLLGSSLSVFTLLTDFLATRTFAETAEKEQASMARTIETVEAIARLLAGYDVDTVAEMLGQAEGQLPTAMHTALSDLEQNLRLYRAYLPAILLEHQMSPGEASEYIIPAPGTASQEATIVFTDILSSTSIWELVPEAMRKGIRTHNAVVRSVLAEHGGYEVKTIGDAFMTAFPEARTGADFGLAVQEQLLAAAWPAALLEVPICRQTERWGGLTVRVGVNHGPVTVEVNTVTSRVDYFGHTVNMAARLEGVCSPGAVAMCAELWGALRGLCVPAVASDSASTELRGVSEAVAVCNVWPASLAGRKHDPMRRALTLQAPPKVLESVVRFDSVSSINSHTMSEVPRVMHRRITHTEVTMASMVLRQTTSTDISEGLAVLVPLIEQSRGTLVTLLGPHFFVGWNLGEPTAAHAESALRFSQRVLRSLSLSGAVIGIASGLAEHGDVGTASQRFVTATGSAVKASISVLWVARGTKRSCLYTSTDALPSAVRHLLRVSTATTAASEHTVEVGTLYELRDAMGHPL